MVEVPAAAVCIDPSSRGRLRHHRVERPDPVPDGRRSRQPPGRPAVRPVTRRSSGSCNGDRPCQRNGKPVTLCGEMAGRPRSACLFGMGLRSFSMSPAFVPTVKALLSSVTIRTGRTVRPSCPAGEDQRGYPRLPDRRFYQISSALGLRWSEPARDRSGRRPAGRCRSCHRVAEACPGCYASEPAADRDSTGLRLERSRERESEVGADSQYVGIRWTGRGSGRSTQVPCQHYV